MRSMVAVTFVLIFLFSSLPVGAAPEPQQEVDEERRGYVLGASAGGTWHECLSVDVGFDIGAACDIRCPGNTCNITVIDEVKGSNIGFRICFDGETFCRPNRYFGHADVPGSRVTVVPSAGQATTGIVIVR